MNFLVFIFGLLVFVLAYFLGIYDQKSEQLRWLMIFSMVWMWYIVIVELIKMAWISRKIVSGDASMGEYQYIKRLQQKGITPKFIFVKLIFWTLMMSVLTYAYNSDEYKATCIGHYRDPECVKEDVKRANAWQKSELERIHNQ